jgi:hypothetical protein
MFLARQAPDQTMLRVTLFDMKMRRHMTGSDYRHVNIFGWLAEAARG